MMFLVVQLLVATRLVVFCEERNIEFLHTKNVSGSSQMLFNPKSHIEKFADSWRYYAKANDIAKREMLKMALRDALHSIERPEKHSLINIDTGKHVNQASNLIKEFDNMYTLSDAVKRTLGAYVRAKKKLTDVGDNVSPETNNKRDIIPAYNHKRTLQAGEPVILKRTSKISVKANLLNNGDVGIEYTSIDPKYSNIAQAERAVRAARIILTYGRKKNAESDLSKDEESEESRKSAFPAPRRHWVGKGLSKIVKDKNADSGDVTGESRSGVTSLMESLANGDDDLPAEDKLAIESLGSNKLESESSSTSQASKKSKKEVVNQYVGQLRKLYERYLKLKEENDTVENALQFQTEIINSNLGNVSKDMLGNLTFMSTKEIVENAVNKSKEEDLKEASKPVVKSIDDEVPTNKQEDTLKELKEARQAKARYEIAKQELAHKIKELYILANNYEKDETENQILEVKNMISHTPHDKDTIIPGAHGVPTLALELTAKNIEARDDTHPGLGSHRGFGKSSILSKTDEHKGSSMGAVEEASPVTTKNATKKQYEYLQLPSKPLAKATKKEDGKNDDETLNIIAQALKEDMKDATKTDTKDQKDKKEDNKEEDSSKLNEDKALAESIFVKHNDTNVKEPEKDHGDNKENKGEETNSTAMVENKDKEKGEHNDTTVTDEKHKQLNILNDIKDDLESKHALPQHYNESVDEYLTKALQEIISADTSSSVNPLAQDPGITEHNDLAPSTTTPNPQAANWPEENDIDDNTINPTEHNKNVVESAMKQHARNPNLPLPLVDTKGDKIKLNPAINATMGGDAGGGDAGGPTTPAPSTSTASATTTTATVPQAVASLTAVHESMQPLEATKPEPKPIQQPTAVLLHATEKNVSTALPDLDLRDPENKQLLDKASHMEESIAAAQDRLYSEAETKLGVTDVETHSKGTSPVETATKETEKVNKDDMFSRNTMEATQDMKPVATSFAAVAMDPYRSKFDPYGSINEKVQGVESVTEDPAIEEGAEEDEEPALHHHHRHHHHRRHHHHHHLHDDEEEDGPDADEEDEEDEDAPEDDDEEDDDDDDDADKDKKSKIKYVDAGAKKRSFNSTAKYNSTQQNVTVGDDNASSANETPEEDSHIDELEDNKRSAIPVFPKKKSEVSKAKLKAKKYQGYAPNRKMARKTKIMKGKTKKVR